VPPPLQGAARAATLSVASMILHVGINRPAEIREFDARVPASSAEPKFPRSR
jgi:hypothetical protein